MRPLASVTDYSSCTDDQVLWMLQRGQPEKVRGIARQWGMVAAALAERAEDIERDFERMRPWWRGQPAEQYAASIGRLVTAIRKVGIMSGVVRDVMYSSADALQQAQDMYLPPGEVGRGEAARRDALWRLDQTKAV